MNLNDEKCSSFVTVILVVVLLFFRIVVNKLEYVTMVVSFFNIVMMSYVLVRITMFVRKKLSSSKINDNVSKSQIEAFKLCSRIAWVLFILLSLVYIFIQKKVGSDTFFCTVNDIIAIITFGISIEEESIESLLSNYFLQHTFM